MRSRQIYVLAAAALIAFGWSITSSFHFDDYSLFSGPLWHPFQIRPITYATFSLNQWISGRDPMLWHVVNVGLHTAVVLLLFRTLSRVLPSAAAFWAALIFAVHPIQAEAVDYVFARSTLLNTLFCVVALDAWLKERRWIAVAWFAVALLCKEECVSFPLFLTLLAGSASRPLAREWKPIAAMLACSLAAGLYVTRAGKFTPGSGIGSSSGFAPLEYLATQGGVILRYLRMLILPYGFTVDPDIRMQSGWIAVGAWLIVIALSSVALWRFKRAREGFWFLGGLVLVLPSSSIFPAADLAADRRMYLPLIAFSAMFGLLLARAKPVLGWTCVAILIYLSFVRTDVWHTERSLWTDAVDKAPDKLRPKLQLARVLPPSEGLVLLENVNAGPRQSATVSSERGMLYLQIHRPDQALVEFGRALALEPNDAAAVNNRGTALLSLGQTDAAHGDFDRALRLDPCEYNARVNLSHLGVHEPVPSQCRFTAEQRREMGDR